MSVCQRCRYNDDPKEKGNPIRGSSQRIVQVRKVVLKQEVIKVNQVEDEEKNSGGARYERAK
jgi:hypothetical protein